MGGRPRCLFPPGQDGRGPVNPSIGEDSLPLDTHTPSDSGSQGRGLREQLLGQRRSHRLAQPLPSPLPRLTWRPRSRLSPGHCFLVIVPAGGGLRTRMQMPIANRQEGGGGDSGSLGLTRCLATPPSGAQLTAARASPPPRGISRAPPFDRPRPLTGPAPSVPLLSCADLRRSQAKTRSPGDCTKRSV